MNKSSKAGGAPSKSSTEGDLRDLETRAWRIYRVLSRAPEPFASICQEILSMNAAFRLINEHIEDNQLSALDKRSVREFRTKTTSVLSELEAALAKLRSHPTDFDAFRAIHSKVTEQTKRLLSFSDILRRHLQEGLLNILEEINESKSSEFQEAIPGWDVLEQELERNGVSKTLIQEEFHFINDWLQDAHLNDETEEVEEAEEEEEEEAEEHEVEMELVEQSHPAAISQVDEPLPDYTAGPKRDATEAKVHSLEQTVQLMTLAAPDSAAVSSSKALPPAYTFEEGSDEVNDEEFSQYITKAIHAEATRRLLRYESHPELVPRPTAWLPGDIQSQYTGRKDIITRMDARSFTTMAYESAPRCTDEIDNWSTVLRQSFEGKPAASGSTFLEEALQTLKSMSRAMTRFLILQDQSSGTETLSDLDVLDFEFSTASSSVEFNFEFPQKEFELGQHGFYLILTYVMGLLELFSDIFPGRTYVTRSSEQVDTLWKEKKMNTRTAWLEKQLAGWEKYEQAINHCRDWHRLRPLLRTQALVALKGWQKAEKILSGSAKNDTINIKVISARNIVTSSYRIPSLVVHVILYGTARFENGVIGNRRVTSLSTGDPITSQDPTWNKTFKLDVPPEPRMVDIQLATKAGFGNKVLSQIRLPFSVLPGVEANFANQSLLYGYDEEFNYPIEIGDGKGKQRAQASIRIGLEWAGRLADVSAAGLPTSRPGKLFRTDILGLPTFHEETLGVLSVPYTGSGGRYSGSGSVNGAGGASSFRGSVS